MTKTALALLILLLTAGVAAANPGDSTNGHGTFRSGGSAVTSFVFDAAAMAARPGLRHPAF